eukprot:evm.model.scf_3301.1 EVM.evm.TU.scf_3301.1   scf_3301:4227-4534(-)
MDPILLTFSEPRLEAQYEDWAFRCRFGPTDGTFLTLSILARTIALVWPIARGGGSAWEAAEMARAAWPSIAWVLWAAADLAVRGAVSWETARAWRTPLVIST